MKKRKPQKDRNGYQILKVQLPLVSSDATRPALVYNKTRTIKVEVPAAQYDGKLSAEPKQFWWGKLQGTVLVLDRPAPFQNW